VKKDNLENIISDLSSKLLDMATDICWNKIRRNCQYILSEIDENQGENFFERAKIRKRVNEQKKPKSLKEIVMDLNLIYENLYDINLYIYNAKRNETIIEIRYFLKTSHTKDYYPVIKNNESMLHCKVAMPPYHIEGKKFDVNWELGGFRHEINMMWSKMNRKKI